MTKSVVFGAIVGVFALVPNAALAKDVTFESAKGFMVKYPDSWVQVPGTIGELDIMSSRRRVEGAVLPRRSAEIIVSELPSPPDQPLATYLHKTYDVDVLQEVQLRRSLKAIGTCDRLSRVDARFEIAPNSKARQLQTFYLCTVGKRAFLTSLIRWESDPEDPSWKTIARRIAVSVRLMRKGIRGS